MVQSKLAFGKKNKLFTTNISLEIRNDILKTCTDHMDVKPGRFEKKKNRMKKNIGF